MKTLDRYRELIEKILSEYAAIPSSYGEIQTEVIFDRQRDRYLFVKM
ncbi:MAG: element excision factor XisI family protein [Cyanobacteriota bacterium]|nr:element excision factor XisI family protein [Cyanobacteriota bacterium]